MSRALRFIRDYPCGQEFEIPSGLEGLREITPYVLVSNTISSTFLLSLIARDFGYCSAPRLDLKYNQLTGAVRIQENVPLLSGQLGTNICRNRRFVIQPINIDLRILGFGISHANILLIDHQLREIELFEPFGPKVSWYPYVDQFLIELARPTGYRVIPLEEWCPRKGPQEFTNKLICGSLTSLYIFSRFFDPSYPREKLINDLINLGQPELDNIIKNYICFEYEYFERENLQVLVALTYLTMDPKYYNTKFFTVSPSWERIVKLFLHIRYLLEKYPSTLNVKYDNLIRDIDEIILDVDVREGERVAKYLEMNRQEFENDLQILKRLGIRSTSRLGSVLTSGI